VGVIRGCVKTVTRGNSVYVKLAYILGLRVSHPHRFFFFFSLSLSISYIYLYIYISIYLCALISYYRF
jgi:hypothetical protein